MPNYKVRYAPAFKQELKEAVDYISKTIQNPAAAENLLEEVEKAIESRRFMPLAFEPLISTKKIKRTYYRIRVKNYTIYYTVSEDVMILARFIYNRRNVEDIL